MTQRRVPMAAADPSVDSATGAQLVEVEARQSLKADVYALGASTSTTIQAILGAALVAGVKAITIVPSALTYVRVGAAASATGFPLQAGVAYTIGCVADTDLRFFSVGASTPAIEQEG